jgi:hypothetical protein
VEALNRIEEFKLALARSVAHYISFLVSIVTFNAGKGNLKFRYW